jgi:hypothetical protein
MLPHLKCGNEEEMGYGETMCFLMFVLMNVVYVRTVLVMSLCVKMQWAISGLFEGALTLMVCLLRW